MAKIINKTLEHYPTLEVAEFLEYLSDDIPKNVHIFKSNVAMTASGNLIVKKDHWPNYWGWSAGGSFCVNFNSPEEALADYNKTLDYFKNKT